VILDAATRPLVIGHRGASAHAGDNTIEALRLAAEHGADGVEVDVRLTSDGVMILHHEPGIHDFGAFADREFADVRDFDPSIPTLDEAAAVLGELFIDVEIKNDPRQPGHDPTHAIASVVAAWIADTGRKDQVLVSSFNDGTIDAVRAADPGIATGQLLDRFADVPRRLADISARGHGWAVVHKSHVRSRGADLVAAAHQRDVLVAVWTVDTPRTLKKLAGAGVDAVITNDPRRALSVYAEL